MTTTRPMDTLPQLLADLTALSPSEARARAILKVEDQIRLTEKEAPVADTPRLGSGSRFKKLAAQVAAKGKAPDASERKKPSRFARLAAKKQQSE